jgi:hypothetical protein
MSKNAFWMIIIVIAAIVGALLGPSLLSGLDSGTVNILLIVVLVGVAALVIYSLSGNRGGRAAAADVEAEARLMKPSPGKARIYIVRKGFVAALQGMNVGIENVATGQIKSNRFVTAEVEPGDYRVTAKMARGGKATAGSIDVSVGPDQVAIVHAYLEMGTFAAKTILTRLEPGEAREKLAGSKMMLWAEG